MMKSGIYKIGNGDNIYIGSTIDFKTRKRNHFNELKRNVHHNKFLQEYYNRNKNRVHFIILEECEPSKLTQREQTYIFRCHSRFNIRDIAFRAPIKKPKIEIALDDIMQDDNIFNIVPKNEILGNANKIKKVLIEIDREYNLDY